MEMRRRGRAQSIAVLGLLVGLFGVGCDRILGIDGLRILCQEGETQCSPDDLTRKQVQSCNAEGRWVEKSQSCGDGQICKAGECAPECTYGKDEEQCDGKTPLVCSDAGVWKRLEECPDECSKGQCTCKAGSVGCDGNKPQKCGENNQWQDVLDGPCKGQTCLDGQCVGECEKGKGRCLGNLPQTCNGMGEWEGEKACEEGLQCHAGICTCSVGDWRCSNNTPQVCDSSNQWVNEGEPCVHKTCDILAKETAYCSGVCAPDEKKCKDKSTPQSCDTNGQWKDEELCSVACAEGKCAVCNPGEKGCDGNTTQICGDDGQWFALTTCQGTTCLAGMCIGYCAPGKRCLGNTPQVCDTMGQWQGVEPCAAGQTCSNGSCTCAIGDRRCFQNTPQICNASSQWVDEGMPCSKQTCDPDVAACVGSCAPGETKCLDAYVLQSCDSKGTLQISENCQKGCLEGACAVCTPNQIRCAGNTPQKCSTNGQWTDDASCVDSTCVAGQCQGRCVFGASGCAGKWPQTCDLSGEWKPVGAPCLPGQSCYQGQCLAACVTGAKRCAGDFPQTCDTNGQWQSDGTICGTCVKCDPTQGKCRASPEPLDSCVEPMNTVVGLTHTCALLPSYFVKCWGDNGRGQLGVGDTSDRGDAPGEMGTSLPFVDTNWLAEIWVVELCAGGSHTCALMSDASVKCWGDNNHGQLGLGDIARRGDGPGEMGANLPAIALGEGVDVTSISAGDAHSCALLSNGSVKCWGDNTFGQLGLGDVADRGDGVNEMGENLPAVDLGIAPGVMVLEISAGGAHTCARLSDGGVKCWGRNNHGQLGLGDMMARGDAPGEMGLSLPLVDLGPGVRVASIRAGGAHTCALLDDGGLKCWGENALGQLGYGSTKDRGVDPSDMGSNLAVLNLGLAQDGVAEISTGHAHTCALIADGSVKCWGDNTFGQLGLGDVSSRGDNPFEMETNLPFLDLGLGVKATSVRAGGAHTCARLEGGSVKCWGLNSSGQLGLFDALIRGDEPNEMGDSLPSVDL